MTGQIAEAQTVIVDRRTLRRMAAQVRGIAGEADFLTRYLEDGTASRDQQRIADELGRLAAQIEKMVEP